jgi:hypothetical protein
MSKTHEKRMVSDTGYEVKQSMYIGSQEVLFAENPNAENGEVYLVTNYREQGIFAEYSRAVVGSDYLEMLGEYTGRIQEQIAELQKEREDSGIPYAVTTAEDCIPDDSGKSIVGKVVVIKADALRPEYRHSAHQYVLAESGFGASANSRGSAVYCRHLNNGELTRFERYQVLGEPKEIPDWAKERLAAINAEKVKSEFVGDIVAGYKIIRQTIVGNKTFALGEKDGKYATWQHLDGREGWDFGHYDLSKTGGLADLNARADAERSSLTQRMPNRNEAR